jgi:hypothetical protein
MVALTTWTDDGPDGRARVFNRGQRVDASDPIVAERPEWFASEDIAPMPPDPTGGVHDNQSIEPERADVAINRPLGRIMRANRRIVVQVLGGERVTVQKGQLVAATEELVRALPGAFDEVDR